MSYFLENNVSTVLKDVLDERSYHAVRKRFEFEVLN